LCVVTVDCGEGKVWLDIWWSAASEWSADWWQSEAGSSNTDHLVCSD